MGPICYEDCEDVATVHVYYELNEAHLYVTMLAMSRCGSDPSSTPRSPRHPCV